MFSLRNINPMVRAVGTMGAIAAIVGGVTFADLNSNTVTLTNNTLTAGSANLKISTDNNTFSNKVAGMTFNNLEPGVASSNFTFYLKNTGTIAQNIVVAVNQADLTGSTLNPSLVNLAISCDNGGSSSGNLEQYTGTTPLGTVGINTTTTCNANATLSSSYSGQGGDSVKPFDITFVGNQ